MFSCLVFCFLVGMAGKMRSPRRQRRGRLFWDRRDFHPTPEQPVGWRGDGTGRFPAAVPPTSWDRSQSGGGYATKGIAWMTPLPSAGVSCPIVVGNRIFLTGETSDLICVDKNTGRILWIRSNIEFEGLSAAERKENPEFAEKLEPLAAELAKDERRAG